MRWVVGWKKKIPFGVAPTPSALSQSASWMLRLCNVPIWVLRLVAQQNLGHRRPWRLWTTREISWIPSSVSVWRWICMNNEAPFRNQNTRCYAKKRRISSFSTKSIKIHVMQTKNHEKWIPTVDRGSERRDGMIATLLPILKIYFIRVHSRAVFIYPSTCFSYMILVATVHFFVQCFL